MAEVAYERWSFARGPNHWVLNGKRSFLGRWSLLMGGVRSLEVLIMSIDWEKKLSRWVVASCEKWSFTRGSNYWALTGKKVFWAGGRFLWEVWLYFEFKGNYAIFEFWLIFFFLFQLIISLFFVPRLFSSFCLLRKCTLSVLSTTVQGVLSAIMMGVMWE